jgi:hypothetical protein
MTETKVSINGQTDAGGAWTAWTPTLTNMTLGNGSVVATYKQIGKTVFVKFIFTLGTTSAMGTNPSFSLPATASSGLTQFAQSVGTSNCWDTSASVNYVGTLVYIDTSTVRCYAVSGTNTPLVGISSTLPMTWATGDILSAQGFYEIA